MRVTIRKTIFQDTWMICTLLSWDRTGLWHGTSPLPLVSPLHPENLTLLLDTRTRMIRVNPNFWSMEEWADVVSEICGCYKLVSMHNDYGLAFRKNKISFQFGTFINIWFEFIKIQWPGVAQQLLGRLLFHGLCTVRHWLEIRFMSLVAGFLLLWMIWSRRIMRRSGSVPIPSPASTLTPWLGKIFKWMFWMNQFLEPGLDIVLSQLILVSTFGLDEMAIERHGIIKYVFPQIPCKVMGNIFLIMLAIGYFLSN